MSIASMADAALQRKRVLNGGPTEVVPQRGTSDAQGRTITPLKQAAELTRYVPTEAIALYVAILAGAFATLSPPAGKKVYQLDFTTRWVFYAVMLGVTAALVWLIYAAKTRQNAVDQRPRDVPVFEMAIAAAAMAAWAAALPDSPFESFKWYGGWFAPIVLSTSTAIIPLIAAALGKAAPTYVEADSVGNEGAPESHVAGAAITDIAPDPTSSGGATGSSSDAAPPPLLSSDIVEEPE